MALRRGGTLCCAGSGGAPPTIRSKTRKTPANCSANWPRRGRFARWRSWPAYLDAVKTADQLKPIRAFEIVELLDRSARPYQRKLNLDYVTGGTRLTKFQQHRITATNYAFQTQLTEGYRFCLAKFEVGAVGSAALKPSLPKIAGRALRACGAQLKWSLLRYGPVDRQIWENLARLYTASEALGFGPWLLNLYRGEKRETTAEREFLRPLMLAISSPDGLLPIQIELADRVIAHCCDAYVISSATGPRAALRQRPRGGLPARAASRRASPSRRRRASSVRPKPPSASRATSRKSSAPARSRQELNLGLEVDPTVALATLQHLARYWSPNLPERKETRRRRTEHVTVVHEFGEVVANAGGLFFESPFVSNDEEWIVENESAGGFGAFVPKHLGALAARGQPDRGAPRGGRGLGRRHRAAGDGRRAGQPLRRHPDARHRRCRGHRVPGRSPRRGHHALTRGRAVHPAALRHHQPERRVHPAAASRSCSRPSTACEMHAYDREYLLTPVALAEQGDDFEIGRFRIVEQG